MPLYGCEIDISIHAPTNGATLNRLWNVSRQKLFQSTLRRTERPVTFSDSSSFFSISIHAPTNGATMIDEKMQIIEEISIHAPTNGATKHANIINESITDFNPRSDERSDVPPMTNPFMPWNFNPRSDERSDIHFTLVICFGQISIHAPTNGATSLTIRHKSIIIISIHAPTNGATVSTVPDSADFIISIHAPTNGATLLDVRIIFFVIISIHAPTNGATACQQTPLFSFAYFNPRSDERSDSNFAQKNLKNYTKPLNNIIVFYN